MSLTPLPLDITLAQLDNWGNLANLGFEILEGGDLQAFGKMTHGAPTDAIHAAYFGTPKGKFRVTYPFSEQATVLAGEVLLTDEASGITTRFRTGESWFVAKGTSLLWEVVSEEGFVKHYLAFV